jgi:biopolymer transport protein ExbB
MLDLIIAGGWLMVPIIICSILATAIIIEKCMVLRTEKVAPQNLLTSVLAWINEGPISRQQVRDLKAHSLLGRIFAAGFLCPSHDKYVLQANIQEAARYVVHEMERFLNFLGTIVMISPMLGLLGTVFGMMQVFTMIMQQGVGNATALAGGIAQALITTAAGLCIAIPTMIFHRYFTRRIDSLILQMEEQAQILADALIKQRATAIPVVTGARPHAVSSPRT